MVHCLNAVLVFPKILQIEQIEGLFNEEQDKNKKNAVNEHKDKDGFYEENDKNKNFWWAHDILKK